MLNKLELGTIPIKKTNKQNIGGFGYLKMTSIPNLR